MTTRSRIAYERKLREMDLPAAFNSSASYFTAQLFRLIAKADSSNLERLRKGFPTEVAVYEEYVNAS